MVPYRPMTPWWYRPPIYHDYAPSFRNQGQTKDLGWNDTAALGGQDPRLTPSGDIARHGTIPSYVPYAVLNPGRIHNIPQ